MMVIADRGSESYSSSSSSNHKASSRINSTGLAAGASAAANGSSSEMNSDSDTEPSVRVGESFQAVIPDYCLSKPAPPNYPEKALMVWTPQNEIEDDKICEYLCIANEKYRYNPEQALGVLFWHNFNLECALSDLANFVPFPDEWSIEDKALFEQAYTFYSKNFHKINTLLPDKKISSLVKYYYTWKKVKSKSFIDKQLKKSSSLAKDDSTTDSATNDALADSDTEFEATPIGCLPNKETQQRQECSSCYTRTTPSTQFYNTKSGLLCRACFSAKRKDGSLKASALEESLDTSSQDEQPLRLHKSLSRMILDPETLEEIAGEHTIDSTTKVLPALDAEIDETIRKIRLLKQTNAAKKEALLEELPEYPLLQNTNRTISRWNESDQLVLMHAIHDYGRDFKTIAEIMGNKTELQVKNYFLTNYEKLKDIVNEYNEDNDLALEKIDFEETAEEGKSTTGSGRSGK